MRTPSNQRPIKLISPRVLVLTFGMWTWLSSRSCSQRYEAYTSWSFVCIAMGTCFTRSSAHWFLQSLAMHYRKQNLAIGSRTQMESLSIRQHWEEGAGILKIIKETVKISKDYDQFQAWIPVLKIKTNSPKAIYQTRIQSMDWLIMLRTSMTNS